MFSNSKNIARIPAVAHLRAFAALLVMFYHGRGTIVGYTNEAGASNPIWNLIQEGYTGVSLFLVLSGFIFEFGARDRSVRYWPFLRNRILRTYPLFLFLMVVTSYGAPQRFSFSSFLQSVFLLGNLPGSNFSGDLFLNNAWTLTVEFQFYLLFPFLHGMYCRHGFKWIVASLGLFVVVRTFVVLAGENDVTSVCYWTILGRLDQFLIGMVLARVHRATKPGGERVLAWGFPLAVGLVLAGAELLHRAGGFASVANWKLVWMDLEALVWGLFILSYMRVAWLWPRAISRALELVGELSYSMYLLHYVVAAVFNTNGFFPHLSDNPNWSAFLASTLVLLPVTLVFSGLTYALIERPFLALRGHYLGELLLRPAVDSEPRLPDRGTSEPV